MRNTVPEIPGAGFDVRYPPAQAQRSEPGQTLFESPRREMAEQTAAPWESAGPRVLPPLSRVESLPVADAPRPAPRTESLPLPESPNFDFPIPTAEARTSALQIHDAYLVFETPQGMLVIDQHALHERILFEEFRQRIGSGQLEVQRLLIPQPVDLPAEQAACLLEAKEELKDLGLEIEDFGGNTVVICSYPTLLSRATPEAILKSVVDCLVSKDRPPMREQLLHNLIATMACKAAVKAGDRLTQEEIDHLMHLREMAEDSHHCPHGRPTSLLFSRQELDKQFRRT